LAGCGIALELRMALVVQSNHLADYLIGSRKSVAGLGDCNLADGKHNQES
jgi:hypothetical protein